MNIEKSKGMNVEQKIGGFKLSDFEIISNSLEKDVRYITFVIKDGELLKSGSVSTIDKDIKWSDDDELISLLGKEVEELIKNNGLETLECSHCITTHNLSIDNQDNFPECQTCK